MFVFVFSEIECTVNLAVRSKEEGFMSPLMPLYSFFVLLFIVILSFVGESAVALTEINLDDKLHKPTSVRVFGNSAVPGSEGNRFYERVHIIGKSRFKLKSYPSSFHLTVKASDVMPEKQRTKLEFCFHGNSSLGLGQCMNEWEDFENNQWAVIMSPYSDKYLDVKFPGASGSVIISIEEEFQQWRLFFLGFGFSLLMLAPVVSSWVPFYYSSSMVLGVLLVILIILFQGMKLLPTGRKSFLYLTLYGSIVGAGSFLVHYFSVMVNSILVNFGLDEEMHNPVSVFLLVGISLSGAAMGYWAVRKFVLRSDGTVDAGIAQFVKWAMRSFGFVLILQSTLDSLLALGAIGASLAARSAISIWIRQLRKMRKRGSGHLNLWHLAATQPNHKRAEFLSRSPKPGVKKHYLGSSDSAYVPLPSSSTKALIKPVKVNRGSNPEDYYSTFHRLPARRRYSKKEWDRFTQESTQDALAELATTEEFSTWMAENARRIHVSPEQSSDDSVESSSDSSEATDVSENEDGLSFFGRFLPH
ncbi:guanosine-3',5'-bis (diphosphate) 3'-pyrophosphohydrolase, putative (DUF2215) [Wolffia australiana]